MMGQVEMSSCCPICKTSLTMYGTSTAFACNNGTSNAFGCNRCSLMYVETIPGHCVLHGQSYTSYDVSSKRFSCCGYTYCLYSRLSSLKRKYGEDSNYLVPYKPNVYNTWVHVKIPSSVDDPHHFGHLPFQFCRLMAEMEYGKKEDKADKADKTDCTKL